MNQVEKIKKLEKLSYFNNVAIQQVCGIFGNNLYANINRWIKKGLLIQLKKGLYVTQAYSERLSEKEPYDEFVANKLKEPSYLSLEYVLQKKGLFTESVFPITSVTLKRKRIYKNKLGVFMYRNIKENLFTGYSIKKIGIYSIKEASTAKALFDWLYYKVFSIRKIDKELLLSFRLNFDRLDRSDLKEFSGYCKLAATKKLQDLPKWIGELRDY